MPMQWWKQGKENTKRESILLDRKLLGEYEKKFVKKSRRMTELNTERNINEIWQKNINMREECSKRECGCKLVGWKVEDNYEK